MLVRLFPFALSFTIAFVQRPCARYRSTPLSTAERTTLLLRTSEERSRMMVLDNTLGEETVVENFGSAEDLKLQVEYLCRRKQFHKVVHLLDSAMDDRSTLLTSEIFTKAILSLAAANREGLDEAERLFGRMKKFSSSFPACQPTRATYEALMQGWLVWKRTGTGDRILYDRCLQVLDSLWKQHESKIQEDVQELSAYTGPVRSTYLYALEALLLVDNGRRGRWVAEEAQRLLDEMEERSRKYPETKPNIVCVNTVFGLRDAANHAVSLLRDSETRYFEGDKNMRPNAATYNIVLNGLAHNPFRGSETQAEELLYHMDQLAAENNVTMVDCRPDVISFNSVLNSWTHSRNPEAPKRAEAILEHMESRYQSGESDVAPDSVSYNTVMTAWARSSSSRHNTERILAKMEKQYKRGNKNVEPTVISFNILINAIARSRAPNALENALAVLDQMKALGEKKNRLKCLPDCVTYTTIIGVIAKTTSMENDISEKAIELLHELERLYETSNDVAFRPTMQTYTSAINAIARGRQKPEVALELMDRLEQGYRNGVEYMRPDCVCYCALLNAVGWSSLKGKSTRCHAILRKMFGLYETRSNIWAKPDIIACNAVLNACAFDVAKTEEEKKAILKIVVDVVETFQSAAPSFGWPNHLTYSFTLQAITAHMTDLQKREEMAQSAFLQCCQGGHVSVPVILNFHRAVSWPRFSVLLGDALGSREGEPLFFSHKKLPESWTKYAPNPKEHHVSRPGSKRRHSFKPSYARISPN